MSLVNIVNFPSLGDDRGELTVLEQNDLVPFDIQRVYYIYNTLKNTSRGFHAHKNLEQLAICISGSCLILLDDGNKKKNVLLDNPNKGLLINKMIWHEMSNFSSDCILMVLANDFYDEDDYIRSYEVFKELI